MENKVFIENLGRIIKEKFGGNQREYERAAGLGRQTIRNYLVKGTVPNAETLKKLAHAAGMDIGELLSGKQPGQVLESAGGYDPRCDIQCSFPGKFNLLSKEEKELLVKTMEVLRGANRDNANVLETTINGLHKSRNYIDVEENASDTKKRKTSAG